MAAAAAHAKDAKELTLYISAHGSELGSSKPLKSSNKKYNTFLEKCLIVYEQGCSGLVNKGYTKISEFYEAFRVRDGKYKDTEDILKSLSVELRDEKCKEYGQSPRKMKMRRRNMETQFESIRDPDLNTFADKLFDKLKNYSDATGRGKIMIDKWSFSKLVKKNKVENNFEIFREKLSEWTGLDKQTVEGLFSMAIEETEPAPKFAEDLFKCSLYSSYKFTEPLNDKKFFMSGEDESPEVDAYMNYGIYLIDIRGVDGGKDDGGKDDEAINLLEKKHGYKFKFKLEQDNTICLSDILFECFNHGFDKVNIIDSSCRLFSSADADDDEDFLERLGRRTLNDSEIGWVTDFTTKIRRANHTEKSKESKKSKKRKSMFRKKKSLKKSISCKKTLRLKR